MLSLVRQRQETCERGRAATLVRIEELEALPSLEKPAKPKGRRGAAWNHPRRRDRVPLRTALLDPPEALDVWLEEG